MRRGGVVAVMGVAMMVMVMIIVMTVGMDVSHEQMLHYNITFVHLTAAR